MAAERISPPPLRNALRELASAPKVAAGRVRRPVCVRGAGNGEPVIVIPGMMSGDGSTSFLRRSLTASGFVGVASGIRFHKGIDKARFDRLLGKLSETHREYGKAPILLGWSLGGIYARALAHELPEHVALVMTLGSPFSGDRHANRAWRAYNLLNDHTVDAPTIDIDISAKPPVPTIAVWSAGDGVVAADCARGEDGERDDALELAGSHIDLGASSKCVRPIIERLGRALG